MTARECTVPGCARPAKNAQGLCYMHAARLRKHGSVGSAGPTRWPGKGCSVAGCERKHHANGYCSPHARRLSVYGDPLATPLAKPRDPRRRAFFDALVSQPPETDDCVLWPYSLTNTGYGQISIDNRTHKVHRAVLMAVAGPPPREGMEAAHNCNVRHCINPRHLRWATKQSNVDDKKVAGTSGRKLDAGRALGIFRAVGTQVEIAVIHGVSAATVSDIKRGRSWGWLTGQARRYDPPR